MKYFACFLSLLLFQTLSAQKDLTPKGVEQIQVREETRYMSQGNNKALVIQIPEADPKLVSKLWKKYLREYDGKLKKGKDEEYFVDDADIPGIGLGNTIDLYSKIEENSQGAELTVWFYLGGAYLQSDMHPERFEEGKRFMEQFALMVQKELIKQELKEQESQLKELENELDKLKRDNERYHQIIEEAEKRIEQAKEDIRNNEKAQMDAEKAIEQQREKVDMVKDKLKKID